MARESGDVLQRTLDLLILEAPVVRVRHSHGIVQAPRTKPSIA